MIIKEETKPNENHWTWGNADYNSGYNAGIDKAEKLLQAKDEEIAHLKKRLNKQNGTQKDA